ncbi:MAG: winged helix-turn-helix transcriptional regulator [Cytophagales bacterium]|nr:winged helix-turn-helix transcriptional regulator [Cytophagales bacterium]
MELALAPININKLEKVAFILKTIAHPLRIGIIQLLQIHERLSVNEICEKTDTEQSLVSHHLSNMKLKGILDSEREGKNVYYFLRMKEVLQVLHCMENCEAIQ